MDRISFPIYSPLRVALSNVDLEGAKKNFEAEHTGFDIEQDLEMAKQNGITSMPKRLGGDEEREILQQPYIIHFKCPLYTQMSMEVSGV